ncbi:MAG: protein-glutamate O-methyltransferase CheR [Pseudomonadota bacterium]
MPTGAPDGRQELSEETFRAISQIAHDVAGLHLPAAKRAMVASRISRRLTRLALPSFDDYLALIQQPDAPERARMVASLTTNVSNFFREAHHFELLRDRVLPPLLDAARRGQRVRVWSAGCANGQEAYSIALTILALDRNAPNFDIRILGTDIDPSVVRTAQLGSYHTSMVEQIPSDLLGAHFRYDPSSKSFSARSELRSLALFRELNLHGPWPMPGRFDVIFCRNVVIYFDEAGQESLWPRFQDKLMDGGYLFVGHSERIQEDVAPRLKHCAHTVYELSDRAA